MIAKSSPTRWMSGWETESPLTSQKGRKFPFQINAIMKTDSIALAGEGIIDQGAMERD